MTIDTRPSSTGLGWFALAGLFLVAAALDAGSRFYPTHLPYYMPWEFSWPTFFVTSVVVGWYVQGLVRTPPLSHPPRWRTVSFLLGVISTYAVLQTHFELLAQHMFFANRVAQFVLQQLAPLLIALGMPGAVLREGLPDFLERVVNARATRHTIDYLQHPVIAPLLFVGQIYFWLIPAVHTRAMLDSNLHDAMDWTVALDGILFWSLVADTRAKPPARIDYRLRMLLILAVQVPQILLGLVILRSTTDIYPIYAICGRILSMSALDDQQYAALIILLPTTVLSLVALLVQLICMRRSAAERSVERESA